MTLVLVMILPVFFTACEKEEIDFQKSPPSDPRKHSVLDEAIQSKLYWYNMNNGQQINLNTLGIYHNEIIDIFNQNQDWMIFEHDKCKYVNTVNAKLNTILSNNNQYKYFFGQPTDDCTEYINTFKRYTSMRDPFQKIALNKQVIERTFPEILQSGLMTEEELEIVKDIFSSLDSQKKFEETNISQLLEDWELSEKGKMAGLFSGSIITIYLYSSDYWTRFSEEDQTIRLRANRFAKWIAGPVLGDIGGGWWEGIKWIRKNRYYINNGYTVVPDGNGGWVSAADSFLGAVGVGALEGSILPF